MTEYGFSGEFGFIPTTYGARGPLLGKLGRNQVEAGRTRHGVFTKEVVDLTSRELLNLWMSPGYLNEEKGRRLPGTRWSCQEMLQSGHIFSATWQH